MNYTTLEAKKNNEVLTVTMDRVANKNSINDVMLAELNHVIDCAMEDSEIRIFMVEGKGGYFCTGVDFNDIIQADSQEGAFEPDSLSARYMDTLTRLSSISLVTIAKVEGQVLAGGIGLVAACDFALASSNSFFSLSEALWGLMPSMVLPFLVRKSGFQFAKYMTLSTLPVSAENACKMLLIDQVSKDLNAEINNLCSRIGKLERSTIQNIKSYLNSIYPVTEEIKTLAVNETSRLFQSQKVRNNIYNFIQYHAFPWEGSK